MKKLTSVLTVPAHPRLGRVEGCEARAPQRQAFYGADEIGVRTPDGAPPMLASFTELE